MTELDAMIARVMPYAGCQLITRFVEATNEPLCVEYLYVIAILPSAVPVLWPHLFCFPTYRRSGDFLLVLSAIGVCVLWLFYQLLLLLAFERCAPSPCLELTCHTNGTRNLTPLNVAVQIESAI